MNSDGSDRVITLFIRHHYKVIPMAPYGNHPTRNSIKVPFLREPQYLLDDPEIKSS
jgi:hypothetical protein